MSKLNLSAQEDLIPLATVEDILNKKSFYTEYQPFVCLKSKEIYAYESLARFRYKERHISPEVVLKKCHSDKILFSELEFYLKKHQFENRPDKKLFVNLDMHAISSKCQVNRFMELFAKQDEFVIEIVENSFQKINVKKLIEIFRKFKFEFAVDDFFKEDSIFSIFLLNQCDYLKLDKDILYQLKNNEYFFHIVQGLIKFIHSQNKKVVLEGVETKDELKLSEDLGIDFVQGFLFKDKFIQR
jgi:EAL domain-containing protein (putative c-di-GMP-specific phosphodiesterase class I)